MGILPSIFIGSVQISAAHLMYVLALAAMALFAYGTRSLTGLKNFGRCAAFSLLAGVTDYVGSKLLFCLQNPDLVKSGAAFSFSGVSFFGVLFFSPLVMPLFCRMLGVQKSQRLDLTAQAIPVMLFFVRIGCFLSGCCGGREAHLFGLRFFWPTQLLECIACAEILSLLVRQAKSGTLRGKGYPLLLILYSSIRFLLEFLRSSQPVLLGLTDGHWCALICVLWGTVWYLILTRKEVRP